VGLKPLNNHKIFYKSIYHLHFTFSERILLLGPNRRQGILANPLKQFIGRSGGDGLQLKVHVQKGAGEEEVNRKTMPF
jgi:hypothetical protein